MSCLCFIVANYGKKLEKIFLCLKKNGMASQNIFMFCLLLGYICVPNKIMQLRFVSSIYCNDFILDSITFGKSKMKYLFVETHLHVVFSVHDSAQFNISQGASCAASVARSLNETLI
jgi:hypothetical protein